MLRSRVPEVPFLLCLVLLACSKAPRPPADDAPADTDPAGDDTAAPEPEEPDSADTGAPPEDRWWITDTDVDPGLFADPRPRGDRGALLAPYPLDDADAVRTVLARLVHPQWVSGTAQQLVRDHESHEVCPQEGSEGVHYFYAEAVPACRTRYDVIFAGIAFFSGGSECPTEEWLVDFHVLGPGFVYGAYGALVDDWPRYTYRIDAWWRWWPDVGTGLPTGEYHADLAWTERTFYGTRDVDGYLYVYDDGAGGPMGDLGVHVALTDLHTCPEEGDGVVTLTGDTRAVLAFDGATDCDGCGRLWLGRTFVGEVCL
jgi:hypothetical protein